MSLIFSRHCEYALQAVLYLALKPVGEKTNIKELTRVLEIPYHFLGKIMQDLTRKGILISQKGPTGGFALQKRPEQITLLEIVDAIDGTAFLESCVLGFPECSSTHPCAVHETWGALREKMHTMLSSENVVQLAAAMKKPAYRAASVR
jgi:Rrf2 family iron-sulfur cluster assembly transcriptional regulator